MEENQVKQADWIQSEIKGNNMLMMLILLLNLICISLGVGLILKLEDKIYDATGVEIRESATGIQRQIRELRRSVQDRMDDNNEKRLTADLSIVSAGIEDMAELLYQNEKDYQLFFRLMKVNMHFLSGKIPGTETWFEQYVEELDGAIDRSRVRQRNLLFIMQYYQSQPYHR